MENDIYSNYWGTSTWESMHNIAYSYPLEPSEQEKEDYYNFYTYLKYVLPNKESRKSYKLVINNPEFKLSKNVFDNRNSLTLWVFNIHNYYNKLLNKNYVISFTQVNEKYESYRAKCNSDKNNSMVTKIWGPHMWILITSICYAYSDKPNENKKKNYITFFKILGKVLPCSYCKDSYDKFIKSGLSELTDDCLKNSKKLTLWCYYLREAVNNKLCVNYGISYKSVANKYEYCKIKNKFSLDIYDMFIKKECPIIPLSLAEKFINYAKIRQEESSKEAEEYFKITDYDFAYINEILNGADIMYDNYKCNFWCNRNIECNNIIKYMRINNIPTIDHTKKWLGLPSITELKLILRMASNLDINILTNMIFILPNDKKTYYKLSHKPENNVIGCLIPAYNNTDLYKHYYTKDMPLLPYDLCFKIINLANINKNKISIEFLTNYKNSNNKKKLLEKRRIICENINYFMHYNKINSLIEDGDLKGTPTRNELLLISHLASNLDITTLNNILTIMEEKILNNK
ncbi:disulfide thiol oxidoreductase, Erv1 / Alr family [Hokovirus HKV1]|uniref:Sulfhydryl oxidase n=1 Tax=Hokovirus HKV1 TaxID=1977638 RepID=A0A1V0SHA4_9VIRU|nr:disulfide thiol oxidoreductase, Erv1 / Alr family [Hokovirus HKV1]